MLRRRMQIDDSLASGNFPSEDLQHMHIACLDSSLPYHSQLILLTVNDMEVMNDNSVKILMKK